jgi:transcriptional regulator with XRE-family HTH domain
MRPSARKLAAKSGVSHPTASKWIRGDRVSSQSAEKLQAAASDLEREAAEARDELFDAARRYAEIAGAR